MASQVGKPPIYTAEALVKDARAAGFEATGRLIADWVELGLLDRPARRPLGRGRGSEKAVWPETQKGLLLTLLLLRPSVSRIAPLANVPVWTWLAFGEEWVPIRQARRALGTWCGHHHVRPGTSATEAKRMARQFMETVVQPHTHPHDRGALRRIVEDSLTTMTFNRDEFRDAVRRVFDPKNEGRTIGPAGAPLTTDVVVGGIEARFVALQNLDEFTDDEYGHARLVYLTTKEMYADEWQTLASDPETGHMHPAMTLDREVNRACYDLLSILGLNFISPEGAETVERVGRQKGISVTG
jgi:hypothetical protein